MLLVTGDRDAFQLVTDDVKVVTTKKGITDIVIYGPDEVLRALRRHAGAGAGLPRPQGRHQRQHPGRARRRGEDRRQAAAAVGVARRGARQRRGDSGQARREPARQQGCRARQPYGRDHRVRRAGRHRPRVRSSSAASIPTGLPRRSPSCASRRCSTACSRYAEASRAVQRGRRRPRARRASASGPAPSTAARWRRHARRSRSAACSRACVTGPDALVRVARVGRCRRRRGSASPSTTASGASLFGDHRDLAVAHRRRDGAGRPCRGRYRACAAARRRPRRGRRRQGAASGGMPAGRGAPLRRRRSTRSTRRASSTWRSLRTCSSRTARPTSSRRFTPTTSGSRFQSPPMTRRRRRRCLRRRRPTSRRELEAPPGRPTAPSAVMRDIEMPLVPVLARMERVGVGLDTSVLAGLSADAAGSIDAAACRDPRAGRRRVPGRLAQAALGGALRAHGSAARQEDQDRLLDRCVRARDARPRPPHRREDRRVPRAHQAQEHLPRRSATDAGRGRSPAHVVQPDGRRHRTAVEQRSQPAEHPGAHRVRPTHPRRVRPGERGRPHGLGGLQPDRAADPRAPLGRRGAHRGVHQRHGLPPGDGRARLRRRRRVGRAGDAGARQGGQLRHRVRPDRRTGWRRRSRSQTPRRRR